MNSWKTCRPEATAGPRPESAETIVLQLEGEFDVADRARLLDALALTSAAGLVVLDLTRVSYVDSTVLLCFVMLQREIAQRNARLVLAGLSDTVQRIFQISGLGCHFEIREHMGDLYLGEGDRVASVTLPARSP
jgi:anti-anti-sigma factor